VYPSDMRNPYVYAGTSPDVYNLSARMADLAKIYKGGNTLPIEVIAANADYWPLPWYLRKFTNVAYRNVGSPSPDAVVVRNSNETSTSRKPSPPAVVGYFVLRADLLLIVETPQ